MGVRMFVNSSVNKRVCEGREAERELYSWLGQSVCFTSSGRVCVGVCICVRNAVFSLGMLHTGVSMCLPD